MNHLYLSFAFISILSLVDCARFRIEELEPSRIASLRIASSDRTNPGQLIQGMQSNRIPYYFPVKPVTDGSKIYIADPGRLMVRVFSNGSGELETLIGGEGIHIPEDIKHIKTIRGIPGWITIDDDENVYIQIRLFEDKKENIKEKKKKDDEKKDKGIKEEIIPPEKRLPGIFNTKDRAMAPSLIYLINDDDKVAAVIGQTGADKPFNLIYRMDAAKDGVLFVCHRVNSKKVLSVYKNGTLFQYYDSFSPETEKEKKEYIFEVEEIATKPGWQLHHYICCPFVISIHINRSIEKYTVRMGLRQPRRHYLKLMN